MPARRTSQAFRVLVALLGAAVLALVASAPAAGSFRDRTPPSVPTQLQVVAVTNSTATVRWAASTDNRAVASYTACVVSGIGGCVQVPHPQTTTTITGLRSGASVRIAVYATDTSRNNSGWSASVTTTTTSDAPAPTAPGGLTVLRTGISTVELRWTSSAGVEPFFYDVLVNGVPTPNAFSTLPAGTIPRPPQQGAVVRQLEPSTSYTFAVRARAVSGAVSAASNTVTATTGASADTVAPSPAPVITILNAGMTGICPDEVWTWWTGSTDNSGLVEYEVRVNGVIHDVVTATRSITYTEVTGPAQVTVVAVDAAGNASAPSAPVMGDIRALSCWG
jgi:chitodextrinase